jgi:hypothetical protein
MLREFSAWSFDVDQQAIAAAALPYARPGWSRFFRRLIETAGRISR